MRRVAAGLLLAATLLTGCGDGGARPAATAPSRALHDPASRTPTPEPARIVAGAAIARLLRPTELRAQPGGAVMTRVGTHTAYGSERVFAVAARHGDWLAVRAPQRRDGRPVWIPAADAALAAEPWSLVADLGDRELTLRRNGRVLGRWTMSIGAPATPTPTGRFGVTDLLAEPPGSVYGCCILALSGHQDRFRPGWDGGTRLAVHGTPHPETIGRADTNGCLHVDARALRRLLRVVPLGATVTIRA
ncbi:MAG: ErfK/YbiS/YcfS/YnhG family protein [Solirubrobacterales bacterium]|jgi:lipoprotein-anchoring transpeptidase ErfK/SrfK|nr:ErfK/YbiS/YcfS/YnhG family protein [Solirubrobacterales bacterium]